MGIIVDGRGDNYGSCSWSDLRGMIKENNTPPQRRSTLFASSIKDCLDLSFQIRFFIKNLKSHFYGIEDFDLHGLQAPR